MSSVSQIITFRKGRAFTTHRSEPPTVPAPPPPPSATVTLGNDEDRRKLASATYTQQVQKAIKIEFGGRPTDPQMRAVEEAAERAAAPAPAPRERGQARGTTDTPDTPDTRDPQEAADAPADADAVREHAARQDRADEARDPAQPAASKA